MPSKPKCGMCGPECRRIIALLSLALSATLPLLAWAKEEPAARPTIYKWVDEHGIAHYTTDRDRIPSSIRNRIQSVPRATGELPVPPTPPAPAPTEPESTAAVPEPERVGPAAVPPLVGPEPETPSVPGSKAAVEGEGWATANVPELLILEDIPPGQAGIDPKTAKELASLDEEIAVLESEIARSEERLLALLAGGVSAAQSDNPELRAIADNLPQLQADLAVLRERRESLLPVPGS